MAVSTLPATTHLRNHNTALQLGVRGNHLPQLLELGNHALAVPAPGCTATQHAKALGSDGACAKRHAYGLEWAGATAWAVWR